MREQLSIEACKGNGASALNKACMSHTRVYKTPRSAHVPCAARMTKAWASEHQETHTPVRRIAVLCQRAPTGSHLAPCAARMTEVLCQRAPRSSHLAPCAARMTEVLCQRAPRGSHLAPCAARMKEVLCQQSASLTSTRSKNTTHEHSTQHTTHNTQPTNIRTHQHTTHNT